MQNTSIYDVVIIGGGAAGLAAAIYASRGGLKTLLLEGAAMGGQAAKTSEIDNYPGFGSCPSGEELAEAMEAHARKFPVEFSKESVRAIDSAGEAIKAVRTRRNVYQTKAIIIATGAKPKKLGVSGEEKLFGAGVSYCAACDGMFFKGKDVAVIGGGNTAFEDAIYLSSLCRRVYLLNRSKKFRAAKMLVDRAKSIPNIELIIDAVADSINGEGTVSSISTRDTESGAVLTLPVSGVFIAIGITPVTELFKGIVELCPRGFVKTDEYMRTSTDGIFAAGDVRVSPLRQIITAAADGAVAGTSAVNYVNGV